MTNYAKFSLKLKQSSIIVLLLCAAVLLAINQPVYAQISEFKLTASDGEVGDRFGVSVSISGEYAIVGARRADDISPDEGSAYIFVRVFEGWAEEAKLKAADAEEGDIFGHTVSISGSYAIVGAPLEGGNTSGSAYIFKRTGTSWAQEAKLTASDAAGGDFFGISVSISGDYAIVGAREDNDAGRASGSAYIFVRDGENWTEQTKLTASDAAALDQFGFSISISGDYAIVGARRDDGVDQDEGSAYIFKRTGTSWAQEAKLIASDAEEFDFFGFSVSISGDYAIVGALADDDDGFNSGSAYVFKRDGTSWAEQTKLTASDAAAFEFFGSSVSIGGDNVIVGSPEGNGRGSAYLFVRDGENWSEHAKLTASDADVPDFFGFSVSISGLDAIVGAFGDEDLEILNGSAYVFTSVQTAQEAAQDVIAQIETLLADALLSEGQGNSLITKLKSAIKKLDQEQEKVALNMLNAFINQVNALIDGGVLSSADGDPLISAVQNIVDSLSDGFAKRTLVSNNANPDSYILLSNYPNPFNPTTRISFVLPEAGQTRIIIYDTMGREVARLVDGYLGAGNHSVTWNASNVASGMYFYRLQASDFVQTRKMVLLK